MQPATYPFAPPPASVLTLPLSGGDAGTAETVAQMCRLVDEGSKDPEVNRLALAILRTAHVPEFNFEGERRAIYQWFRKNIRFLRDIEGKETLRAARETLANQMGDCDCQTIAMLALLKTIGQRVRIVTVATQPQAPEQFSHVFAEVRDERGRWIPMDAARKKPRYGLAPRGWFRRYGWDTESCKPVDLDRPEEAADFDDDGIGALNGLGVMGRGRTSTVTHGWGLRGPGSARMAPRRMMRGQLRGLGIDWGDVTGAIQAGTTGAAQIIAASRAAPITLAPAAMTPQAQAGLFAAQQQASGASSLSLSTVPSWMWILGGGLLLVVAMKGR